MPELTYTITKDRHGQPLVTLESPMGNGQDINPAALRDLASLLTRIADQAEQADLRIKKRGSGKYGA
jgi:hypothetical protein